MRTCQQVPLEGSSNFVKIDYRQAVAEDIEFLYRLHRETMQHYVEQTWGAWDEAWQHKHFIQQFDPVVLQIIQVDGQEVGVLYVQERNEEIFLASIEILPAYQGQGIGTEVIRALMRKAGELGKPVALQVLKVNLQARALYQRLGFGITGENDTHYIMAYENWKAT